MKSAPVLFAQALPGINEGLEKILDRKKMRQKPDEITAQNEEFFVCTRVVPDYSRRKKL
ncbi:MAG TPA: hypothetical protein VEC13_02255 [Candidatus Paceibacterota bacterium]|nr:hypothetical protein [Candidatus Paceibacterota bacterium]